MSVLNAKVLKKTIAYVDSGNKYTVLDGIYLILFAGVSGTFIIDSSDLFVHLW